MKRKRHSLTQEDLKLLSEMTTEQAIAHLYSSGFPTFGIKYMFDISLDEMYRIIKANGVPLRNPNYYLRIKKGRQK